MFDININFTQIPDIGDQNRLIIFPVNSAHNF
jgi:hypothetical protein